MEIPKNSDNINKFVKYILYELKARNIHVSKTFVMDLIFKIKYELGESHPLYSQLPFYWYSHGPFSSLVEDSFNFFSDSSQHTISSEYNDSLKYSEIETIANEILDDDYNSIKKEIYQKYAPYAMMKSFRFDIFDVAIENDSAESFDQNKFVRKLYECEALLPFEPFYQKYNKVFSKFITNLDFIIQENNFDTYWPYLRKIIIKLHKTFSRGIRLNHKDEYYNDKNEKWTGEYLTSLKELCVMVEETNNLINLDNYSIYYSETESKMIDTTIGKYLDLDEWKLQIHLRRDNDIEDNIELSKDTCLNSKELIETMRRISLKIFNFIKEYSKNTYINPIYVQKHYYVIKKVFISEYGDNEYPEDMKMGIFKNIVSEFIDAYQDEINEILLTSNYENIVETIYSSSRKCFILLNKYCQRYSIH